MALTASELDALRDRVAQKGWLEISYNPDDGALVDRIVACSEVLDEQQRELFGHLIDSYLYVRDITPEIHALWVKIRSFCFQYDLVYIVPLKNRHETRTKSGDSVCYSLSSLFPRNDEKFTSFGTPFSNDIKPAPNSCIVIVDDFVGTGDSVEECCEQLRKIHPDVPIVVATIVIQERGLQALEALGLEVVRNYVRNRVISDGTSIPGAPLYNLDVYNSIERQLVVSHEYRLGYGASEAVVTVTRTPDNTLPIFWWNHNSEAFSWPAPFPRR